MGMRAERGIDPGVFVGADSVSESGEALRQPGPEREAPAHRYVGADRPERADMLGANLAGDAPILHQADLKASCLPAKTDEHRSGIEARVVGLQRPSCHYVSLLVLVGSSP